MANVELVQFSYSPKIINGGFAGIIGITCVFPIDLIKTRLQNQRIRPDGTLPYKGIVDCAIKTWQNGGSTTFYKIRSLYSGSAVNIALKTPEKAIQLSTNDFFRYMFLSPGEKKLSTSKGMIAGALAGLCHTIVTTPMELLKIQLQQGSGQGVKLSATRIALNLLKEKGIAGIYKGLAPCIARDVPYSCIYFPLFARLDSLGPRKVDDSGDAVFYVSFISGIIAGATAAFCVTPADVIKTRMQVLKTNPYDIPYKNMGDAIVKILHYEGPKALFKGACCRMLVLAPLFGIAQTVYYIGVAEKVLGIEKNRY